MRSVSHFESITTYRSCWLLVITDQIQTKPHIIFSTSHYERNRALLRTVVQQDMRIAFVLSEGDAAVNHVHQPLDTDCIMGRDGRSVSETVYCLVNSGSTAPCAWSRNPLLHQPTATTLCVISNFRRGVNEVFARLDCFADYIEG
jgi:hypothetical protein